MRNIACLVVVLVAANAAADRRMNNEDSRTATLAKLRTAAKCDDPASPWRVWCAVADADKGTAEDLPKPRALVGLTLELAYGGDVAKALRDKVSLAALAIDADGKVKLTAITPSNAEEKKLMAEAVVNLAMVFKGKAALAKLPDDLASYVKTLKASYTPTKVGGAWTWKGASDATLRKVGSIWVAIETPAKKDGIFATILTDAWE